MMWIQDDSLKMGGYFLVHPATLKDLLESKQVTEKDGAYWMYCKTDEHRKEVRTTSKIPQEPHKPGEPNRAERRRKK